MLCGKCNLVCPGSQYQECALPDEKKHLINWTIMQFDPFVIPFNLGLYFVILYCVVRVRYMVQGPITNRQAAAPARFFGKSFVSSLKEIFMESLIHRKVFRANRVLGYMHMSLAFGWFLLILFRL
ncbi:MAG: hypothetical protein R2727_10170 [Bacteroidales bacterium]